MTPVFLFIVVVLSHPLRAAARYTPAAGNALEESWRWTAMPQVSDKVVRDMAQTADGTLWFATENGLYTYDGLSWTGIEDHIHRLGNSLLAVCAASDGSLYAGSYAGIGRYAQGSWKKIWPLSGGCAIVNAIVERHDGSVWFGTPYGVIEYLAGRYRYFGPSKSRKAFTPLAHPDKSGPNPFVSSTHDIAGGWWRGLWDEEFFFVYVTVTDEVHFRDSRSPIGDDGVDMFFDIGNEKSDAYDDNDLRFYFPWEPSKTGRPYRRQFPDGRAYCIRHVAGGYAMEIQIPWRALSYDPHSRRVIGFDVHINDDDDGGDREGKSTWHAQFNDTWRNPRSFGEITFDDTCVRKTSIPPRLDGIKDDCWAAAKFFPIQNRHLRYEIADILEDSKKRLWFSIGGIGIVWHDPARGAIEDAHSWHYKKMRITWRNNRIYETARSRIWIQYKQEYYSRNNAWERFPTAYHSMFQLHDGTIYGLADYSSRIVRLDGESHAEISVHNFPRLESIRIPIGVFQSADSAVWFYGAGNVLRCEYADRRYIRYPDLTYHCETRTARWFTDRAGKVIAQTADTWRIFAGDDGLPEKVRFLRAADDIVWAAGTRADAAALSFFDGHRWHRHAIRGMNRNIRSVCTGKGDVWVSSIGGDRVLRISPRPTRGRPTAFQNRYYRSFIEATGNVGASRLLGFTDNGRLWAIHWNHVHVLDADKFRRIPLPEELRVNRKLCGDAADKLWIGAETGILCIDPRKDGSNRHFTMDDGLSQNTYTAVTVWPPSQAWAVSRTAVDRFDGTQWVKEALPVSIIHDTKIRGIRRGADSVVWINTSRGAIRYHPDTLPPQTEIMSRPGRIKRSEATTITWRGWDWWNHTGPEAMRFSWKLDASPWSPFSATDRTRLTNLSAGQHVLAVRSRDRDFIVDDTPARIRFVVTMPFYATTWFILGTALVFITLLSGAAIIAFRRGRLIRIQRQGVKRAEDEMQTTVNLRNLLASRHHADSRREKHIPAEDEEFLRDVTRIIEENCHHRDFDIEQLCKSIAMGRRNFEIKFKSLTKTSPGKYMREIRMEKAARLLLETDLPISEIAFRAGYNDVGYFCKIFKRHYGKSLHAFRTSRKSNS